MGLTGHQPTVLPARLTRGGASPDEEPWLRDRSPSHHRPPAPRQCARYLV